MSSGGVTTGSSGMIATLGAAYSTVSGPEIARCLAQTHDLGGPVRCNLIRRGFSDTYLAVGEDGRRYVARLSGPHSKGGRNVDYETALLAHLKARGVAVSAAIPMRDGALWRPAPAAEGPRALVLFEFLDGPPPMINLGDVALMGRELAEIHRQSADYAGPPSLQILDAAHLVERPAALVAAAAHLGEELRATVADLATKTAQRISGLEGLTQVACHGDCHGFNTLMVTDDGGRRRGAFFDFDDAGPGPLAYDLAVYLWNIRQRLGTGAFEARHRVVWTAFLDGYAQVQPIPQRDLDAISLFVRAREIWFLGQYADQVDYWGTENFGGGWIAGRLAALHAWDDARPFDEA